MSKVQKSNKAPVPHKASAPATKPRRRARRWLIIGAVAFFGVLIFSSVGFLGATTLEEHDDFCTSCHTVPETTYFHRATTATSNPTALVTDLATYHYHQAQTKGQTFACIDCHRGDSSLSDRVQTLALGARDTMTYLMGKADPALEKKVITDPALVNAACVSCHTETMLTANGIQTHFHNFLPQTATLVAEGKQVISANPNQPNRQLRTVNTTVNCTSCHLAHQTVDPSDPQLKLVDVATTQTACDTCHKDAGER